MRTKRFFSLLLCAVLIFTMLPTTAQAASDPDSFIFDISEGSITIGAGMDSGTLKVTYGTSQYKDNIPDTQEITIIGSTTANAVTVSSGVTTSITLSSASIDMSAANACAFELQGTANVTLTLESGTTNSLISSIGAGLQVPENADLTIGGTGTLTATYSGWATYGAGIGGGNAGGRNGTININSGTVEAIGYYGAGIGGGQSGDGGTVNISGGTVTASSRHGAGIGGGELGDGGIININGGTVTASSNQGAGIGGGYSSSDPGTVTISGGSVKASGTYPIQDTPANGSGESVYLTTVTLNDETGIGLNESEITSLGSSLSYSYGITDMKTDSSGKLYLYLPDGSCDLQLGDGSYGYAASPAVNTSGTTVVTANDLSSTCVNITGAGTYHLTQSSGTATANTISVNGGSAANPVNITLNEVNIDTTAAGVCAFDLYDFTYVDLTLSGDNQLESGDDYAGLHVPEHATIFIDGGGTVTAIGSSNLGGGAGIGGNYGERGGVIRINGGSVTAQGGDGAAGIGGGKTAKGGQTTIDGGMIAAQGGTGGAGIGGGSLGGGGTIQINGGQVTAVGGQTGAGIGGGEYRPGGEIIISGGVVIAESESGAGIGGGASGNGGDIAVSGGTITAASSGTGAGIGGGAGGDGGVVFIFGGSIKSTGAAASGAEDIGYGSGGSNSGTLQNNSTDLAPVFLTKVTLSGVTAVTAVSSLTAILGSNDYDYGIEDMYTDAAGNLYLYLPTNASVTQVRTADTVYNNISGTFTADTGKPAVAGVTPSGTGAALSGNIVITFDEDMKTPQTGSVSLNGTLLAGGTWSVNNTVYTVPYSGLTYGTTYTVKISGFADYSGNEMDCDTANSFTTQSGGGGGSSTAHYTITASAGDGGNISPSGSASVAYGNDKTYTITANAGYEIEAVLVDGVSGGAVSTYTFKNVKKAHTITASFIKTERVNPFMDITENDWFYNNVLCAYENGLMTGTSLNAFSPNGTMTRAMAVTALYRLSGKTAATSNVFSDVAPGAWYEQAAAWAAANDIANGVGGGLFVPGKEITREQLAVMLYNYAKYKGYDVSAGEDTNILSYGDALDVSDYAYAALQWACGTGILTGDGSGNLNPQCSATRAEISAMLQRFITSTATD